MHKELHSLVHHQDLLNPGGTPHLTKKNEFEDVICWSQNDCEILIKDQKKLEKTVLPLFFRHNKIESFVRQLNMYRFSKVNKVEKERNHLYFKNEHFRKGNM